MPFDKFLEPLDLIFERKLAEADDEMEVRLPQTVLYADHEIKEEGGSQSSFCGGERTKAMRPERAFFSSPLARGICRIAGGFLAAPHGPAFRVLSLTSEVGRSGGARYGADR